MMDKRSVDEAKPSCVPFPAGASLGFTLRLVTVASPRGSPQGAGRQAWGFESDGLGLSPHPASSTQGEGPGATSPCLGCVWGQGLQEPSSGPPPLWAGGGGRCLDFWPGLCSWAGWAAFSSPQLREQLCGPHALRQRHLRELEQIPLSFPPEETITPAPGPPWKPALLALSSDNVLLEGWIKQTCVYRNFVYTCVCVREPATRAAGPVRRPVRPSDAGGSSAKGCRKEGTMWKVLPNPRFIKLL